MASSSFDQIAQEILRQKHIMEQMEQENRELRSQLADLREGRGIFIDICGKRFAVTGEFLAAPATAVPEAAPIEVAGPQGNIERYEEEISEPVSISPMTTIPETPRPDTEFFADAGEDAVPTFLEETMSNEFGTAVTSPMVAWSEETHKQEIIDEEEKAELRRQLIGSFLLE